MRSVSCPTPTRSPSKLTWRPAPSAPASGRRSATPPRSSTSTCPTRRSWTRSPTLPAPTPTTSSSKVAFCPPYAGRSGRQARHRLLRPLAAAAAVILVALGGAFTVGRASAPEPPPTILQVAGARTVQGTGVGGATLQATVAPAPDRRHRAAAGDRSRTSPWCALPALRGDRERHTRVGRVMDRPGRAARSRGPPRSTCPRFRRSPSRTPTPVRSWRTCRCEPRAPPDVTQAAGGADDPQDREGSSGAVGSRPRTGDDVDRDRGGRRHIGAGHPGQR